MHARTDARVHGRTTREHSSDKAIGGQRHKTKYYESQRRGQKMSRGATNVDVVGEDVERNDDAVERNSALQYPYLRRRERRRQSVQGSAVVPTITVSTRRL